MSKYNRLTVRHPNSDFISITETKQLPQTRESKMVLDRLAELEDKIENGDILEFPCRVGDTVYILWRNKDSGKMEIFEDIIIEILVRKFSNIEVKRILVSEFGPTGILPFCDMNKIWFLNKAEAEAKLRELNIVKDINVPIK